MAEKTFAGQIEAKIYEARFAMSGKVGKVLKTRGDNVRPGELLAVLDRQIWQMELDRQLIDYEKTRAEFEVFNLQTSGPVNEVTNYLKTAKQAQLNASVKEVELAKIKLDQTSLLSPVEGIITDDGNLIAGIYVTSSSNPISILATASYHFRFTIEQEDLAFFVTPQSASIKLLGFGQVIAGTSRPIIPSRAGLVVEIDLPDKQGLIYGLKGEATF